MKKWASLILALVLCLAVSSAALAQDTNDARPRVKTLENGVMVQTVPGDGGYNLGQLHADSRGCAACHADLEALLKSRDHVLYKGNYPTGGMKYFDCLACHSYEYVGASLQDPMHNLHNQSAAFAAMGGSCESCHYVDEAGEYTIWDYVQYELMQGIADLAVEDMNMEVSWNQTEQTKPENMMAVYYDSYYRSEDKLGYSYDHVEKYRTEDWQDTLKIRFTGDLGNPCELSINEMKELFGSETRVIGSQCVINGVGGNLVYQREVTGIPVENIFEYLQVKDNANLICAFDLFGYGYPQLIDFAKDRKAILVYEMDGEPLKGEQGFPLALWYEGVSLGDFVRNVFEVTIYEGDPATHMETYGYYYKDTSTGYIINTPNIGVLNHASGTIWNTGDKIHLNGYANAFDKPITKIEFTFDNGKTWKTVETTDASTAQLVFWNMNIEGLEPGSYVLRMRTTCQWDEETELVNQQLPEFLINVK